MASISRNYQPGYQGTTILNGNTYTVQGWKSKGDPGLWDCTNLTTGGWMFQEVGIQKISFDFTVLCKLAPTPAGTNPVTPAVSAGVPDFKQGDTIPVTFTINGSDAYVGQVIITGFSVIVDIKGGVTFDLSADSQGPMTGSLAVTPSGQ